MRIGNLVRRGRYEVLGLFVLLGALVAVGALFGVSWAAGWHAVLDRLRNPEPEWFAAAFGAELFAYLGYILAYREVARFEDGAELELTHAVAVVAAGFGVFVAAGGYFVDTEALEDAGLARDDARSRVMGLGALEYALLAPAALGAALYLILDHVPTPSPGFTWPWAIAVPAGFAAALVTLLYRRRLHRDHGRRRHLRHPLAALRMVAVMGTRPHRHGLALIGMATYWLGDIACLWACLQAFGVHLAVPVLIVTYATGYALTRRTLPLGGAGIVEALLPFALLWGGSPLAAAVLAVFAYRVFNLWLPLLPALASLPVLRRVETAVR